MCPIRRTSHFGHGKRFDTVVTPSELVQISDAQRKIGPPFQPENV